MSFPILRSARLGALALLAALALPATAQTLRPEVYVADNRVEATALSEDGSTLYIGGNFEYVGPNTGHGARVSAATGETIAGPVVSGIVYASAPDGAGGLYLGGAFRRIGATDRPFLAHLLADGSVDPAWTPEPNSRVRAITVVGSTVYVGGDFTRIDGVSRRRAAALDAATGALLPFDPNASGRVNAILVDGGTAYLGGQFSSVGGQARGRLAAVDATTGALLPFQADASGNVEALVLAGGALYAGGSFTQIGGVPRRRLAAVDPATGVPTAFDPDMNNAVLALATDGTTLYAGGQFTGAGVQFRTRLAAFDVATGDATAFNPGADGNVFALTLDGGTLYAGGFFEEAGGQARLRLAAFDTATGALAPWDPSADDGTYTLTASGGAVFAGGNFQSVGGEARTRIAALDAATGTLLPFRADVNSVVEALAVRGDAVYVGGRFSRVNNVTRRALARLDATTGSLDASWNPNPNNAVLALALDGNTLYAGGFFSTVGGQSRPNLAAVDASDATLQAWNPAPDGSVQALALGNGVLYAGGYFSNAGGQARNAIAALDLATGDATPFDPDASGGVLALAVGNGVVYAGGTFFNNSSSTGQPTIGGQPRDFLAALDPATGAATAWDPDPNESVTALALGPGVVYAGGNFRPLGSAGVGIGGAEIAFLAALDPATGAGTALGASPGAAVTTLTVRGDEVYAGGPFNGISEPGGGLPRTGLAAYTVRTVASSSAAGWRMLAPPVSDLTVASLAPLNLVGGVAGDPACATSPANLYTGYTGTGDAAGYTRPGGYTEALASGKGFFWYFYDGSVPFSCGSGATASSIQPLPVVLRAPGAVPTQDVETTFTAADRAPGDDTFYLAGNPFSEGFDLDGDAAGLSSITAADADGAVALQSVVQIWDPAAGGYVTVLAQADGGQNGTGGVSQTDDLSIWQGVWVERAPAASPAYPLVLTYDEDSRTGRGSSDVFVGRPASTDAARMVRFEIAGTVGGERVYDGAAALLFAQGASEAWDAFDASKLPTLGSAFALVAPVGQGRDGAPTEKASESRGLTGGAEVPLAVRTSGPGTFSLSWAGADALPAEWTAELTDTQTGATTDLRASASLAFEAAGTAEWQRRFVVRVGARTVGAEGEALATRVGAAFPNPTSGRASVVLQTAQSEHVRADVFNMLGQRVATVFDGPVVAGETVSVAIETRGLASGSYVVRIAGESFAESRRLTVVR